MKTTDVRNLLLCGICCLLNNANALDWHQCDLNTGVQITTCVYGSLLYICVGFDDNGPSTNSISWTSANAVSWNAHNTGPAGPGKYCSKVRFFKGMFIALVSDSDLNPELGATILTSSNGTTWTQRYIYTNTGQGWSLNLNDICISPEGRLVAVGGIQWHQGPSASLIVWSDDGINWHEAVSPDNQQKLGVVLMHSKFL